ncbi:hypothetical protein Cni_G15893 [Canna indica]|uniref:Pentatricopeptide repeat-containing protein n=1 Tax=Canna indica TaxID=4628 RepID=A0AAQ3QG92_9LILI|nr:hypothetical protein Cni_G15893 [Canna indica]
MLLRGAIALRPPFQSPPFSSATYSQVPLAFRQNATVPRSKWRPGSIHCSISQVHSYGTVDYERRPPLRWSTLYRRISTMEDLSLGAGAVLDRWEAEEKRLSKWDLCRVAKELRKFRRFKLALEVYNWMTAQDGRFTLTSSDMAIQLDLIAKVDGISRAEEHFSNLPDTLKDKRTYGALLNVYGQARMKEKAEATVETMKYKGYASDALPFNVMMTLYMNVGEHEKVRMMFNEMKEKNVSLDVYTYNILITNCAAMQDAQELERVVGEMFSDSTINANWTTYTTLATMYTRLGNFEKAESCLKDAEIRITGRDRTPFNYLIGLYGNIGKREEVYGIWNWYKSSFPNILNLGYQSMLTSLIRLGDMDGADVIYDEWLSTTSNYDPRICNILMSSYIREGMVGKAKDVLDGFLDKGGKPRPITWELLAEGYTKEKQLPEAMLSIKAAAAAAGVKKWKPKPANITSLLELCKEKNDMSSLDLLLTLLRDRGVEYLYTTYMVTHNYSVK